MKRKSIKTVAVAMAFGMIFMTACSEQDLKEADKIINSEELDQMVSELADELDKSTETDSSESVAAASTDAADSEEKDAVINDGTPWIDSNLKENVSKDMKTDPKDDFHLYASKEWLLENEIPDGETGFSHYRERGLEVINQCIGLLKDESLEGHDAELIQTYNKLLLDWDTRNAKGVEEIKEEYDEILASKSIEDINKLILNNNKLDAFFEVGADTGFDDPTRYLIGAGQPGVLLDDPAEYKTRTEYGDMLYGYKKNLFVFVSGKMGMKETDAEECFDKAIELEAKLSEEMYTTNDKHQADFFDRINNIMSFDELVGLTKVFPLEDILTARGYKYDGEYMVTRPDYFKKLDELYTDENAEGFRNIILVNYINGYADKLDRETYEKKNELYNEYYGTTGSKTDERMAYDTVRKILPASLQKVYISKYGSAEDKKKMEDLGKEVIETYRELIMENDWISEETRNGALEKIEKMSVKAAYPEKFRDTSKIDISGCSLIEAYDRIIDAEIEYNKSLIGTTKDKEMWAEMGGDMTILDCNAFYASQDNTMYLIIGMMGEPFYSSDMSTEELYASIGAFWAGHEVSHAFDDRGSQFDGDGNYKDWWTEEDKKEFHNRVGKMQKYLDSIVAFGGKHFKGSAISGEMIADMTGLQCALHMAKKVPDFDYDKFFTKFAQLNAQISLYSDDLYTLTQNEHPLGYSRTNVPVQQFEEFYETYDVKEGDNMYLAPEDRLVIW